MVMIILRLSMMVFTRGLIFGQVAVVVVIVDDVDVDDVGSGLIFYLGNQKAPSRSRHDSCRLKFTLHHCDDDDDDDDCDDGGDDDNTYDDYNGDTCDADDDSGDSDGGGDQFGDNDCSHGDIDCGDTRFKAG